MGRAPCCDKANVKRGPWAPEEDATLKNYVEKHGTGENWITLPQKAGLNRCGKSCRLRWLNYLRPDIKHGGFTEEEDNIICSVYKNIGSRWSVIASYLPGRTDNDVKNYWNTKLKKKLLARNLNIQETTVKSKSKSLEINTASVTPLMKTGSYDFGFSNFGTENSSWPSMESSFGCNLYFPRFITDPLQVPLPGAVNEAYVLSESQEISAISSLPVDNSTLFWPNNGKIEEDLFTDIFSSYELPNAGDINQQFLQNFSSSTDYDNNPQELYQSPIYDNNPQELYQSPIYY